MSSLSCPVCGLVLPARARFCARCGAALPGARPPAAAVVRPPVWVLALFWLGTAGTLLLALGYGLAALAPEGGGSPVGDEGRFRLTAAVITALALALAAAQLAAAIGLTGGFPWARVLATLVCVVWCLTCVGLPLALLALNSIWRSPGGSGPARPPSWP